MEVVKAAATDRLAASVEEVALAELALVVVETEGEAQRTRGRTGPNAQNNEPPSTAEVATVAMVVVAVPAVAEAAATVVVVMEAAVSLAANAAEG